ncbi:MAG: DUF1365 domain-containing protein [Rhodospirillales bacterium]
MTLQSVVYRGAVVHERVKPKRHRLRYDVFSLLVDIDELAELDRRIPVFGHNRFAPMSFYDSDHGPLDGNPLRPWVEDRLSEAGIDIDGGPIRLLCYPRIFGYVFNPLSVFFCYDGDGDLAAVLYEVCNTFGERHTYVLPVDEQTSVVRQTCRKALYVSPFIPMSCLYKFRIAPPGEDVKVVIRQEDGDGLLLAASFNGTRSSLTPRSAVGLLLGFPLMTLKIIAAIHWEALKLWLKGIPVIRHTPAASPVETSFGSLALERETGAERPAIGS